MTKPRLLLYVCCAPCSTAVAEKLQVDYEVEGYFYGPNIHPKEEYQRRLGAAIEYFKKTDRQLHIGPYDPARWFTAVRGLEQEPEGGRRCPVCFRLRLRQAAEFAKTNGCDCYATTLSVSPYKNAELINQLGQEEGTRAGVTFVPGDYKKQDGFKRSLVISREYNLYRQHYCGCIYSLNNNQ